MDTEAYQPQPYSKVRVRPKARYDKATVFRILDSGLVAHVGFVIEGRPMVIPMAFARVDETIYVHGAKATRIIKSPAELAPVCLTVTHIDGLVVARSAFHHSVNYRSVVVHGTVRHVSNAEEKELALIATTNHLLPDRWSEVRPMSGKEFKSTGVLAIKIDTATAKIRQGQPIDEEDDYKLPYWGGVLPVIQSIGTPINDGRVAEEVGVPRSLKAARRKFNSS
ncbi:pyridoxamine 5'-phosphate oxidase family protein [Algimonas porphyrae]|uniref:Pyridoxamine 5'-phosphate oxidase family protein n=1 Tax=Algimonas porphyrae TaxID=1128113 RepID=A0ABQ5V4C2_9PROT|nr:pyridoxamine 5'-phosphate oxidase family protein [Algimonas porphyrae]GLQ21842.1 hypothetical protein GCM10007854_27970 [Algimonas porphyrae]